MQAMCVEVRDSPAAGAAIQRHLAGLHAMIGRFDVARRLHLSRGTVCNYVSAILRKTGARNRLEAVRMAEEAGWL